VCQRFDSYLCVGCTATIYMAFAFSLIGGSTTWGIPGNDKTAMPTATTATTKITKMMMPSVAKHFSPRWIVRFQLGNFLRAVTLLGLSSGLFHNRRGGQFHCPQVMPSTTTRRRCVYRLPVLAEDHTSVISIPACLFCTQPLRSSKFGLFDSPLES